MSSSSRIRQSTKMSSSKAAILTIVMVVCFVSGVVGSQIDGRPRPENFPDAPTAVYGPDPVIKNPTTLAPIDCSWYGWANEIFPADTGAACLTVLRKALTNATVNPPSSMQPYRYYTLKRLVDSATNQSYCYIGCFKLEGTAPSAAPSAGSPPPMLDSPPSASVPAPSTNAPTPTGSPPVSSTPEGSVSPSPSGDGLPPTGLDSPSFGPGPAGGPLTSPPSSSAMHLHPSGLFSIAFLGVALILSLL